MTEKPLIIVNFKAYAEVDGDRAVTLAKVCDKVSKDTGIQIIPCPPVVQLANVVNNVDVPVFSQNVDPKPSGAATGWITPSMISSTGSKGTLINHSEHRFDNDTIGLCVENCRKQGLTTVVCAESIEKAIAVAKFEPDMIAIEPPELIGGDISVTTANPDIVRNCVEAVKRVSPKTKVLCGAGVKTGKDVSVAAKLGADGVLLASGVVKAKDPESVILDLISDFS